MGMYNLSPATAYFVEADILASGMTWGATLVVPQAFEWNTSINHSATSLNYGILLQGFGGIIAVPFIDAYGRFVTRWDPWT